jgi:hypothetical protein
MNYCTYAYLRENGTPYYIGKGLPHRPYSKNRKIAPPPRNRILILKTNLTEEAAIRHEIYMIAVFGRKDNETGILRNLTDGGEGISGYKHTDESKRQIGISNSKYSHSASTKDKISKSVSGFRWYNNGVKSIQCKNHPGEGWATGRIIEWDTPRSKGMKWYHRDGIRKMFSEDPGDGWVRGLTGRDMGNNSTNKGKKWYNDGKQNKMFVSPPEGWSPGMIRRKHG